MNKRTSSRLFTPQTLTRGLGALVILSFLVVSFTGAAAPQDMVAGPSPDGLPKEATPTPPAAPEPGSDGLPQPPVAPPVDPPAAPERVGFQTGDRLDAEEIAAFQAQVAAMKAQGQHRGIAVW